MSILRQETSQLAAEAYVAFVSYSHADRKPVEKLHRQLERFVVPKRMRADFGGRKRLRPVFLDRSDYRSTGSYEEATRLALANSAKLVVACTPNSARSEAVSGEIMEFRRIRAANAVLPIILAGEPNASRVGRSEFECFPEPLRFELDASGQLTGQPANPIAADARPQGDGPRDALLKIVAGIVQVPFDDLKRRHLRAVRIRALQAALAAASLILVLAAGATVWIETQGRAQSADLARASIASGDYDLARQQLLDALPGANAVLSWMPESVPASFRSVGASASGQVRGAGCSPNDIAPDQSCSAAPGAANSGAGVVLIPQDEARVTALIRDGKYRPSDITLTIATPLWNIAVAEDGRSAIFTSRDNAIEWLALPGGAPIMRWTSTSGVLAAASASQDEAIIVGAHGVDSVKAVNGVPVVAPMASTSVLDWAQADPAGRELVLHEEGGRYLYWTKDNPPSVAEIPASARISRRLISPLSFSPASANVVLPVNSALGGNFILFDPSSGGANTIGARHKVITFAGFTSSGDVLSGGIDRKLRWWTSDGSRMVREIDIPFDGVAWAATTANDRYLLVLGMKDGEPIDTLLAYNAPFTDPPLVLRGHTSPIRSASLTPDGIVVTVSDDASIRIWLPARAFETLTLLKSDPADAASNICTDPHHPFTPRSPPGEGPRPDPCARFR